MSVRVVKRSPIAYVTSVRGADVGWLSTGRIGFGGFSDRAEACRAGESAGAVLAEWYRTRGSAPEPWEDDVPLEDAIGAGGVRIGRVWEYHLLSVEGAQSWGVEFRIPHATWVAVMLELAQRMHTGAMGAISDEALVAAPPSDQCA